MTNEEIAALIRQIVQLASLITCIFADDVATKINAVMIYLFFTIG